MHYRRSGIRLFLLCGQAHLDLNENQKALVDLRQAAPEYFMRSLAIYEMRDEQHSGGLTHQRLGKALKKQSDLDSAEREYLQANYHTSTPSALTGKLKRDRVQQNADSGPHPVF